MLSLPRIVVGLVAAAGLALLVPACGGGGVGSSEYADKCSLACKTPTDGPCAGKDTMSCETSCNTELEGMSVGCAQCIVEHSGWAGAVCTCTPSGDCTFDTFGPGDNAGGGGQNICDPTANTTCDGFDLAKTSEGDCKAACAAAAP